MRTGFTPIEAFIGVLIVTIIGITAFEFYNGAYNGAMVLHGQAITSTSYGIGGIVEIRCIDGFKFYIDKNGTRQMMDEFGKGVRCQP